jgi:hypothetical protein
MANDVYGKEKSEKMNAFAKGGTTKMFGPQDASTSNAGTSSPNNGRKSANNKHEAVGGKGKMFGPQAADQQAPGVSGHVAGTSQKWGVKGGTTHMFGPGQARNQTPA